jgi:adenosylhomocysteine nucleosidase
MNVLITYAVEAEFAPWRKLRSPPKVSVGGKEVQRIQIEQTTVDFVITGMGAANARRAAQAVLSPNYAACLISGFAGALSARCKLGEVVAPEKVQRGASDTSLPSVKNLQQGLLEAGAVGIPTMISADHVIGTAAEKASLAALGDAVDMESFAILEVAREKNIPAAVVRVISDAFDSDLPEELDTMVGTDGSLKIGGVVRYVTSHPTKVPALLRLGRDSKAAAEALTSFLEKFIKTSPVVTPKRAPSDLQEVAS